MKHRIRLAANGTNWRWLQNFLQQGRLERSLLGNTAPAATTRTGCFQHRRRIRLRPSLSAMEYRSKNASRFAPSAVTWVVLLVLCFSSNRSFFGRAAPSSRSPEQPTATQKYEWESWNFYKILGLEGQEPANIATSPPYSSYPTLPSRTELKKRIQQRKSLDSKDVRKAYRKQAQLWHPDKYAHKINQQKQEHDQKSDSPSASAPKLSKVDSVEECNARFARIAEAYQVLSDEITRREYDLYLEQQERNVQDRPSRMPYDIYNNQNRQYQDPYNGEHASYAGKMEETWSDMFDRVRADPRKVFEEFFYGWFDDGSQDANAEKKKREQERQQQEYYRHKQRQNQLPVRTYEKEEYFNDPYTGEQLLRLLQKHEFPTDPDSGQFYYRVEAQEFRRVGYHVYYGWQIAPISEPYLVEEGYQMDPHYVKHRQEHQQHERQRQQHEQQQRRAGRQPRQEHKRKQEQEQEQEQDRQGYANRRPTDRPSHIMMPGDILTPGSKLLISPNGRFYAGMSPQCELLVVLNNTARFSRDDGTGEVEDEVVWGSDTFAPHGSCFATLQSSRLVIALGEPHRPVQTLWVSDEQNDDSGFWGGLFSQGSRHHPLYTSESTVSYQMQLDNDGSLTIYRIKTVTRQYRSTVSSNFHVNESHNNDDDEKNSNSLWVKWRGMIAEYLEPLSSPPPEMPTRASRAWMFTRHWVSDAFLGSNYLSRKNVGSEFGDAASTITYKSCIFTTSPTGCNRAARRSRQLAWDVGRFTRVQVVRRLQGMADTVVDLLDGNDEDDAELFDRIARLFSAGIREMQRRLLELQRSQQR